MQLLANPIRPYAWGSATAIPELLGIPPTGQPQAELWMGAHPSSPSAVTENDDGRSLLELVEAAPERELGRAVYEEFGPRFPFLLKVLAADEPLSLQAHPNAEQARAGFARENAAGVRLDAADRNYKDAYAKPELIAALTRFEALAGFRPVEEVLAVVRRLGIPRLAALCAPLETEPADEALSEVFTTLVQLPAESAEALVEAVLQRCESFVDDPDARLVCHLARFHPGDVGLVVALLLNHVVLEPGEGIYLPTGNMHAYVHGVGVEILANSDNVLRGGLTGKHVDLPELRQVLDFTPGPMPVLRPIARDGHLPRTDPPGKDPAGSGEDPAGSGEVVYVAPARQFRLSRVDVAGEVELDARGPQILLCVRGQVHARGGDSVELTRGASAYAAAADGAVTLSRQGTVFRASAGI